MQRRALWEVTDSRGDRRAECDLSCQRHRPVVAVVRKPAPQRWVVVPGPAPFSPPLPFPFFGGRSVGPHSLCFLAPGSQHLHLGYRLRVSLKPLVATRSNCYAGLEGVYLALEMRDENEGNLHLSKIGGVGGTAGCQSHTMRVGSVRAF